jgi:ubiquinone/menaquinone biosynthesis C-methylase UbiE
MQWPQAKLTGIDPTGDMIAVARGLAPSVSFHVASAESIPVADGSIDLAVSSISLHHWGDPAEGLREVARTLRPGGRLCLADLSLPRLVARLLRSGARTPAALRSLVTDAGLEVRELRVILARVIVIVAAVKPGSAPLGVFHPGQRPR